MEGDDALLLTTLDKPPGSPSEQDLKNGKTALLVSYFSTHVLFILTSNSKAESLVCVSVYFCIFMYYIIVLWSESRYGQDAGFAFRARSDKKIIKMEFVN